MICQAPFAKKINQYPLFTTKVAKKNLLRGIFHSQLQLSLKALKEQLRSEHQGYLGKQDIL